MLNKIKRSGKTTARSAGKGKFVLGRTAFAKVSAVEGIHISKRLDADLRELEQASGERRRAVLAGKYRKG